MRRAARFISNRRRIAVSCLCAHRNFHYASCRGFFWGWLFEHYSHTPAFGRADGDEFSLRWLTRPLHGQQGRFRLCHSHLGGLLRRSRQPNVQASHWRVVRRTADDIYCRQHPMERGRHLTQVVCWSVFSMLMAFALCCPGCASLPNNDSARIAAFKKSYVDAVILRKKVSAGFDRYQAGQGGDYMDLLSRDSSSQSLVHYVRGEAEELRSSLTARRRRKLADELLPAAENDKVMIEILSTLVEGLARNDG